MNAELNCLTNTSNEQSVPNAQNTTYYGGTTRLIEKGTTNPAFFRSSGRVRKEAGFKKTFLAYLLLNAETLIFTERHNNDECV